LIFSKELGIFRLNASKMFTKLMKMAIGWMLKAEWVTEIGSRNCE